MLFDAFLMLFDVSRAVKRMYIVYIYIYIYISYIHI